MKLLLTVLLFTAPGMAVAQDPPAPINKEIESLFSALESSGCEVQRNGSWYGAKRAAEHLRRKYDYLLKKRLVPTTQAFIDRAGSVSSLTGRPYQVRCPGKDVVESKAWFQHQLDRLRKSTRANNSFKTKRFRGSH